MPELPEVETVRRGLQPAMEGQRIAKVEVRRGDLRWPLPKDFAQRLKGRTVTGIGRRAKYLLADLSSGDVLVMHLGMSGSFHVFGGKDHQLGRYYHERQKHLAHDHVVFHMGSGATVTFNDPRRFGSMKLVARQKLDDEPLPGVQHKYPETVLVFPKQGQTCHAYCTYCFRWAQFVDEPGLKMATVDLGRVIDYLRQHREVTSVLITGGDPMIMGATVLRRYVEPLLGPGLEHIESVRIGSKSLAYWPQRFVSDPDADDTLRLFEQVVDSGRSLAFMAHFSHPRELESTLVAEASRRIRATGAVIRTQAPLIRTINDNPAVWATMWRTQVRMGMVPYYMFVERDTGPQDYFAVPLAAAHGIFNDAYRQVAGLCRTVRGPSMSATPGKVCVDGIADVAGQRVFVLHMIQARDPDLVGRPFFARYDPEATWLTELRPAFADRFPFEAEPGDLPGLWSPAVFEPAS